MLPFRTGIGHQRADEGGGAAQLARDLGNCAYVDVVSTLSQLRRQQGADARHYTIKARRCEESWLTILEDIWWPVKVIGPDGSIILYRPENSDDAVHLDYFRRMIRRRRFSGGAVRLAETSEFASAGGHQQTGSGAWIKRGS